MTTIEFWARLNPDRTLDVPPEVASRIHGDDRAWAEMAAEQFLAGYDASDALYDDLPTR